MTIGDPAADKLFHERWEVVHEDLRARILSGELRPGTPIKEVEIADRLGVSRGPVREAIRALEVGGLVSRRPQRTSIVTPISERDVDELYSLRVAIEDLAIERSMSRDQAAVARELRARLPALVDAVNAGGASSTVADLDIRLHSVFYEKSDHSRLLALWRTMSSPLRLMMTFTNSPFWGGSELGGAHTAIVEAVERGDTAEARRLSAAHLSDARVRMMSVLRDE